MNQLATMESLTIAQIQQMYEREQKRKQQCKQAYERFVARQKENGVFTERKKAYNDRYRAKQKTQSRDEDN